MTRQLFIFKTKNLTCGSCEKVVERAISKFGESAGMKGIDFDRQEICVECEPSIRNQVAAEISGRGYPINGIADAPQGYVPAKTKTQAGNQAADPAAWENDIAGMKRTASMLVKGDSAFAIERELAKMAVAGFFLVLLAAWLLYSTAFNSSQKIFDTYGFFIALDALASIAIVCSVFHFKLFKIDWSCTNGMMIGMGIGMCSGFLAGALIGATNGMFAGSIVGMGIGMAIGAWAGNCCGIHGILEGLMAGLMSGTMGAMLSVMMASDHLAEFLAILWITVIGIMAGISYMMYKEGGNLKSEHFDSPFFEFLMLALVLFLVMGAVMLFAPKSGFAFGPKT